MAYEMTIAEAQGALVSRLSRQSTMAARPAVVPVCLFALGYAPFLVLGLQVLLARPQPVAILAAVVAGLALAWKASLRLGRLEPGAHSWSIAAVGLGMVAFVVAGFAAWPWLATISAMSMCLAAAYALGSARLVRAVLPAWVFVAFAVLPAVEMELWLVGSLQSLVTACAGALLDALGVIHLTAGNVIKIASGPLLVEEACSGVSSLFAAMGATLFYALWTGRKPVPTMMLVLASVCWVVLVNACRVVAVVFAAERFGVDLASGWRHDVWGFVIFAAVMGLMLSTEQLLHFLTAVLSIRIFVPKVCGRGADLRLMPSVQKVSELPRDGRSKIIVAVIDQLLHFRIIGSEGLAVLDANETKFLGQARKIAYLRQQLERLWPPHQLTDAEKVRVMAIVTSITDHAREGSVVGTQSSAGVDFDRKRWGLVSRRKSKRRSTTRLEAADPSSPTVFPDVSATWLASRSLGWAFAILGLAQAVWLWPLLARAVRADSGALPLKSSVAALESLNEGDLPDHLGPHVRAGAEAKVYRTASAFGEFSREWHYRSERALALAAVDYPFRGWHDLTYCYENNGWTVKERQVRSGAGVEAASAGACVEAVLERSPLGRATLIYGMDDMRGNDLKPPQTVDPARLNEKLDMFRFARGRLAGSVELADQSLTQAYQVRLLIQTSAPLSAEERKEARVIFARLRQALRHRVTAGTVAVARGDST